MNTKLDLVYLDNSATTPVLKQAADKAYEMMTGNFGNPSSLHNLGIEAEQELKKARNAVASSLRCDDDEIFFTSGGTESNNLAIYGAAMAQKRRGKRIVTSAVEHPSVLNTVKHLEMMGFEALYLKPVDGVISAEAVQKAIDADTVLVTLMAVNNETGLKLPIDTVKRAIMRAGSPALIHIDAVQSYGKMPIYPKALDADLMSISGHKVHAPKGIGALYIRKGVRLVPSVYGGGQESGVRSGTENMPGIAAFGVMAQYLYENLNDNMSKLKELRAYLEAQIANNFDNVIKNSPENGASHILNISFLGMRSETMLHFLESRGVYVSAGSACGARKNSVSPVLKALKLAPEVAESALRISLSYLNTKKDIDSFINTMLECKRNIGGLKG